MTDPTPMLFGRPQMAFGPRRAVVVKRLTGHTFISRSHRILATTVPKAACTTVKTALSALTERDRLDEPPHGRAIRQEMRIHLPGAVGLPSLPSLPAAEAAALLDDPGFFCFTFVRNPFARLHSAWADKIRLGHEPLFQPHIARMRARSGGMPSAEAPTGVGFACFLRCVAEEDPAERDVHWASQVDIAFPQVIPYSFIGRVEDFATGMAVVAAEVGRRGGPAEAFQPTRLNVTEAGHWRLAYDAELAALVRRAFAADFEAFGYDPEDWRPRADTPHPDPVRMLAARERMIVALGAAYAEEEERRLDAERRLGRAADPRSVLRPAPTLAEAAPRQSDFAGPVPQPVAEAVFDLARADRPGIAVAARCALPGLLLALAAGALSRPRARPCLAVELEGRWVAAGLHRQALLAIALGGAAQALRVIDMPVADFATVNRLPVGVLLLDGSQGAARLEASLAAFAPRLAKPAYLAVWRPPADFAPDGFVPEPAPEPLLVLRRAG
ncbi:sulfotransferase family protein [Falsiroseomonas selenitidurans]|uniref:Sulfotransferase family protein n=1 Tax=Falsiroseomonas selenitidurans TaxID=2716335 RepID=A0ABX1E683_9PROT|nr:sulfotransferase family protein [Falsiroseomonas selenitidurans]NKC30445.1 sulfotransferase family protein [Falsiroseomonas selenitidurans]